MLTLERASGVIERDTRSGLVCVGAQLVVLRP
jgi:hypothetical protein